MVTRVLYLALCGAVAIERLVELGIARRNLKAALARGGREYGAGHFPVMVTMHVAFLCFCPLEVWLFYRPFLPWLALPSFAFVFAAQALRYWCIATLGERWNTRVIIVPGAPLVAAGPYRWLDHPNYVAVVTEIAALPLVHTAWLSAIVFSFANAVVLRARIAVEDRALGRRV